MPRPEESLNEAFGNVLGAIRQRAELSQEALAARSWLHRTYISQLERGQNSPSLDVVAALAKSLCVRPHELAWEAGERENS